MDANIYDGKLDFRLNLDRIREGNDPRGTTTLSLQGMSVSQLVDTKSVTGTIVIDSKLRFSGNMLSELIGSLDGWSRFAVSEGTLNVIPIKNVAAIVESIQGKASSVSQWPDLMPFTQLVGEHNFNDGVGDDQQFSFESEFIHVTGQGGMDYFDNTINYDVAATLIENANSQFSINPAVIGIEWPLHCEGSLDDSAKDLCLPNRDAVTELAQDIATQELKRQGEERLLEEVPEEHKDAVKSLLKGCCNNMG